MAGDRDRSERFCAQHRLPRVLAGHVGELVDVLEPSEEILEVAMARLEAPSPLELVKGLHNHPRLVGTAVREANVALGGLLAVTPGRVIYVARTVVRRDPSRSGNERISIPLRDIRGVRVKRGVGVGDARKLLSLTVVGSRLWIDVGGAERQFVEVKPLDAADAIAAAIRSRMPGG